jgi:plastocyanin
VTPARLAGLLGLALGAAALTLVLAAGEASATGYGGDENRDATVVAMLDNEYLPQTLTVDPGTVVRWENDGRTKHNVIPDKRSTGWRSPTIRRDRSFEQVLEEPGAYGYFCTFHGEAGRGMYGTLIVKNPDGSIPEAAVQDVRRAPSGKPKTIRVPEDRKRIQSAVDHAPPGSLILVSPGVYREAVTVTTDNLVIRGLDRNRTILDGAFRLDNGVEVLDADGVAVENMTARRFTLNGFFWTGATGYRGSYLTATRNGSYGTYAFDSTDGIFEHVYGSGSPDAALYIGQCYPCNALVTDVLAEYNGLGYSGTNAGGNLIITKSVWRRNRVGVVPNTLDSEANPPQREATVVGNLVYDNNNEKVPAIDAAILGMYNGILVAGGTDNVVQKNRVFDHDVAGIGVVPIPDENIWLPFRNKVLDNVVSDSRIADLAWFGGADNCFADNTFRSSAPTNIEQVLPCAGPAVPATDQFDVSPFLAEDKPESVDYRRARYPKPPKLPGMKNAAKAKARPARNIVVDVDIDAIRVPPRRMPNAG